MPKTNGLEVASTSCKDACRSTQRRSDGDAIESRSVRGFGRYIRAVLKDHPAENCSKFCLLHTCRCLWQKVIGTNRDDASAVSWTDPSSDPVEEKQRMPSSTVSEKSSTDSVDSICAPSETSTAAVVGDRPVSHRRVAIVDASPHHRRSSRDIAVVSDRPVSNRRVAIVDASPHHRRSSRGMTLVDDSKFGSPKICFGQTSSATPVQPYGSKTIGTRVLRPQSRNPAMRQPRSSQELRLVKTKRRPIRSQQ